MKKIGIMGGSFNPIHIGHLHLAESARVEFGLDQVIFVPTGDNPFKTANDEVDRRQRYKMVEMAISSNPNFFALPIEIDRYGKSYTIDTIQEIQKKFPESALYFITGADIMFEVTRWKQAELLLKNVVFITAFRPGCPKKKFKNRVRYLKKAYHARILKLVSTEMDIASTDIRKRIKTNKSIKYLLPESVEEYIKTQHLYQTKGKKIETI